MSDKPKAEDSFVYVSEKYLKELEQKAQDSEYFRGRVHGMEKERAMIDLKAIALELLEKYGDSENAVICEYSGNIDEDMAVLEKEIADYYEKIESMSSEPYGDVRQEAFEAGFKEGLHYERKSADRPQEWIPCSERLPSEQGQYLVTFPLCNGEPWVYILSFNKGKFYETDDEWGDVEYDDVTAWMPLPKPWKGADDE